MKTRILNLLVLFFLLGTTSLMAQDLKKEKFEVKGSCGMCETKIEKAAKSVDGVKKADWNLETNTLQVSYDESKTGLDSIQQAIAQVGYDTEKYSAPDEVYNKLPGCCKYNRK